MSICKTKSIDSTKEWTDLVVNLLLFNISNGEITINIPWVNVRLQLRTEWFEEVDLSDKNSSYLWIKRQLPERMILESIAEEIRCMDRETLEEFGFTFNYVISRFKEVEILDDGSFVFL